MDHCRIVGRRMPIRPMNAQAKPSRASLGISSRIQKAGSQLGLPQTSTQPCQPRIRPAISNAVTSTSLTSPEASWAAKLQADINSQGDERKARSKDLAKSHGSWISNNAHINAIPMNQSYQPCPFACGLLLPSSSSLSSPKEYLSLSISCCAP